MSSKLSLSSSTESVISAHGLSKIYHLYNKPEDRLKQFIYPRLRRLLGKPPRIYFREFWALRDILFDVRKGETVGIIGRNGSGKSTLLQLVAGTLTPTFGNIQVNGRVAALLELGAGFNPEFSGRENIYLNAAILGMTRQEISEHIEAIIAFADIGDFIDQPVKTYSSGMYVRVAFSTAINVKPDILIVDEALSVGDTAFQQKCLHRIREMQENGVSILLVTHSNNILLEYCDRGIFLKNGQVVFDGDSRDAVRAYGLDVLEEEGGGTSSIVVHSDEIDPAKSVTMQNYDNPASGNLGLAMEISAVSFLNTDGVPAASFECGAQVFVSTTLKVRSYIPMPAFGIHISSVEGITLWTTTTKLMNIQLPSLSPGTYVFHWQLKANFSGNRYIIALGAGQIEGGEYKRVHRVYGLYFDILPVPYSGIGWLAPQPIFEIMPTSS